jgi:hypothetical protein
MKYIKLALLFITILLCSNTFAQTKEYTTLLSKALNALYADLPNDCKNLYGKEDINYKGYYQSKITLPNSTENRFCTVNEQPIEFTSFVAAGDDKEKAIIQYNNISKAVMATTINYTSTNYKLLTAKTKTGDYPSNEYKLENGPQELENISISVFLTLNTNVDKKYKYHIGIGIYGEIGEVVLAIVGECISGNCENGKGSIKYSNGDKYTGDFKNAQPDGQGIFTQISGTVYTGSFKNGMYNGLGTLEYPNYGVYIGNFVDNEKDGKGKLTELNGDYVDGEWKNNKLNGQGKYYFKSTNTLIEGIFKDDKLVKKTIVSNQKDVSEIIIPSKEYSNLLDEALNSLYADMPNNCKSLYGNPMENSKYTYLSKISLPNSIKNTIARYDDFPVIYESNITAGNDNEMAKQKQNEINNAILSTSINYKNKNYTIKYLAAESREGNKPHFVYSLENGPKELDNVKIYLKLMSNPDDSKLYKFIIAMGIFKQAEVKK